MRPTELMKQYGIGLTGGIGTGKSTVGKILTKLGYDVIDADQISKEVSGPKSATLAKIVEIFSGKVLNQDGTLNRKALRNIVFEDGKLRKKLEDIVHPQIQMALESKLRERGLIDNPKFWFYEASLILETGKGDTFHQIWLTSCSLETQIQRVIKRDKISREDAEAIIETQMPQAKKAEKASVMIDTKGSLEGLEGKLKESLIQLQSTGATS